MFITQQNKTEFTFHNMKQLYTDELIKVEVIRTLVFAIHLLREAMPYHGFIQDFLLEGGDFLGIVNRCMRNKQCVKQLQALLGGGLGACPPPRNVFEVIAARRLNLVSFGS